MTATLTYSSGIATYTSPGAPYLWGTLSMSAATTLGSYVIANPNGAGPGQLYIADLLQRSVTVLPGYTGAPPTPCSLFGVSPMGVVLTLTWANVNGDPPITVSTVIGHP